MSSLLNKTGIVGARALGMDEAAALLAEKRMGQASTNERNQRKVVSHAAGTFLMRIGGYGFAFFTLGWIAGAVWVMIAVHGDVNNLPHDTIVHTLLALWPVGLPLALSFLGLYVAFVGARMTDPELASNFIDGARDLGAAVRAGRGTSGPGSTGAGG